MAYAFVRNLRTTTGANLKHFSQIQSAEAHAKRVDLTSQKRKDDDRDHANNYFWSKAGTGLDKTAQLQERLADPMEARKWAFITIGAAAGAALAFALLLWVWGSWTIGRSERRVEQAEAELNTISMELNELRLLRQQIGLEIRRNDNDIVEIALGDVMLRPHKGQTLVITDEGRELKPFSVTNERTDRENMAAVRGRIFYNDPDGVRQYSGRVWRTVDEE